MRHVYTRHVCASWLLGLFMLLLSLGQVAFAADTTERPTATDGTVRQSPPSPEARAKAMTILKDLYRREYTQLNTQAKRELAKKMLAKASELRDDRPGLWALLNEARDLAVTAKDASTATDAVAMLHVSFQLSLRDQFDDWSKVGTLLHSADGLKSLAQRFFSLSDRAVSLDDFELAVRAAQQARLFARQSSDVSLAARAESRLDRVRHLERQYQSYRSALVTLEKDADDKAANLAAGSFLCAVKADWSIGLPMLTKGADTQLAELAKQDLKTPTGLEQQIELADGWWGVSEKPKKDELVAELSRQRALAWYRAALPESNGLLKEKIRSRLDAPTGSVDEHGSKGTDNAIQGRPKTVDLLARVDLRRDPMRGEWKKTDQGLLGGSSFMSMLRIPYEPGDEYDFVVEFTRLEGRYGILQLVWCPAGKCQVDWVVMSQHGFTGFGRVGEKTVGNTSEASLTGKPTLDVGKRHTSLVQVRKWGLAAYLDGKRVVEYRTDFKNLSAHSGWGVGQGMLGLGANSRTVFHRIEVLELSGD